MRIIVVGGEGTIGRAVVAALSSGRHEIITAGRTSGALRVDIESADSVQQMFRQVGPFDALVSAAGNARFGSLETMTEDELVRGVHGKLLGQIRLVLLGRSYVREGGSFTLTSGYLLNDPIPGTVTFAVANGGIEGFVRASALEFGQRIRINAVSPGMAEDSAEHFGHLNPGRLPTPMRTIGAAYARGVEGFRTGEIIPAW
ncbi:short chain dehydrogenase [Archangium violaceum]|uniref:short chain dehydrogenase n=1 Tax=Archangium violaceum TaxID=83451 RepID=UPI00194E2B22|nr:short chain dehydrogenase [Archangium violaceum]QRN97616.1 short chain dehydrogenase [Archangium violaceum]